MLINFTIQRSQIKSVRPVKIHYTSAKRSVQELPMRAVWLAQGLTLWPLNTAIRHRLVRQFFFHIYV